MADQEDLVDTQMVKKANKVTGDVDPGVGGGGGWGVGVAISTEVRGYATVAKGGEGEKLVAPWVPEVREAVKEEDHWACTYWSYVHIYAICGNCCVLYLLHLWSLFLCFAIDLLFV